MIVKYCTCLIGTRQLLTPDPAKLAPRQMRPQYIAEHLGERKWALAPNWDHTLFGKGREGLWL